MKTSRSLVLAVSASFAGVLWLAANPALADGLRSKDKVRTPQTSYMQTSGKPKIFVSPVSDEEKISLIVHRTVRANERRNRNAFLKTKQYDTSTNSNPALRIDRERLIRRGMSAHPMQCSTLHTHERAVCQRDAQLQKTNRIQLAFK